MAEDTGPVGLPRPNRLAIGGRILLASVGVVFVPAVLLVWGLNLHRFGDPGSHIVEGAFILVAILLRIWLRGGSARSALAFPPRQRRRRSMRS